MRVDEMLMCIKYIKPDLEICGLEPFRKAIFICIEGYSRRYECTKLIDNYMNIINLEPPKYYQELYNSNIFDTITVRGEI